ncbi:TRAP transporter substrate-binding protein DctP [Nocardioides dubius]|uniref:C4-dicarboxylate ABC transporter substrate-binding protein n=1 Tax=Nocardioides dubius TaxID=317019 RepID=A0ABN1TXH2_9ACTN
MGVVLSGALAACAEDGGGSQSGGDGVAAGATQDDYVKAFEDVDAITLVAQTPAPKGSVTGLLYEDYFKEIEEWSGGKLKFDVNYAYAIAPVTEQDDALRDGRLDITFISPMLEPDQYPANAALVDMTFVGNQSPTVGPLQGHGTWNSVAFEHPQVLKELEDQGMHVLMPAFAGGPNGIFCTEKRATAAEIDGTSIIASGTLQGKQLQALGASPVSIDFTEVFEALQRGTADCAANSLRVTELNGLAEVVPYAVFDESLALGQSPGAFAVSKARWDELPLVAQQLLHDKMDMFLKSNISGANAMAVTALKSLDAAGGSVSGYDDAARTKLEEFNSSALAGIADNDRLDDGQALVDTLTASSEEWAGIVEEMGVESVAWPDYVAWSGSNEVDLDAFVATFMEKVMSPHRPS